MIKKTLYFGNPAYLSTKDRQLVIKKPCESEANEPKSDVVRSIPIEDIGVIVLDNPRVTITQRLMGLLMENNCALVCCDESHLPSGLFLPLACNTVQHERFVDQMEASLPLKKQLWAQTIQAKIHNQACVLEQYKGKQTPNMYAWADQVKSGDTDNKEAQAAAYYWKGLFEEKPYFFRDQFGPYPNCVFNYGYSILRAIVARALVSSGLLPTFGIHHHNRYNAYCLADDIMEPYRPYVDELVLSIMDWSDEEQGITKEQKIELLKIPTIDVSINGKKSPLEVAASITTASLYRCYSGESRRISYPYKDR